MKKRRKDLQKNRHGIPVVAPEKTVFKNKDNQVIFTKKLHSNRFTTSVLNRAAIINERKENKYAELSKLVDGLEVSTHVVVGSAAYVEALQQQFQIVCEWEVSGCLS